MARELHDSRVLLVQERIDMAKTVAELLVDVLAEAGTKRIYGVPGDPLNGITDSIRVRKDLSWIGVRHEEAAEFAAGACRRRSGRPLTQLFRVENDNR